MKIATYTVKDIYENPAALNKYQDPYGYVRGCNGDYAKVLKSNPHSKEDDIALILTIDNSKVAGRLGLYAGRVIYNQKEKPVFWMAGFFLGEAYKNSGAGGLMLLKAINFSPCLLAASGRPNAKTQKLYNATGFREIGVLKRFIYIYSSILKPYYRIKTKNNKPALSYRRVAAFGTDVDEFLSKEAPNRFPRYSNTLNWALQHKRGLYGFKVFRNQELIGYCLLRKLRVKNRRIDGSLLDYYLAGDFEDAKKDLILFGIEFFKKEKANIFECQTLDDKMARACSQLGMIELIGNNVFFRPSPKDNFEPNADWYITYGSGDEILVGE